MQKLVRIMDFNGYTGGLTTGNGIKAMQQD